MNGPMRKDLFRSIKKSLTRFLSIVAIIALGISFFVGMKSASPDMRRTANDYFTENNLMDIEVYSTIGFTTEEIDRISSVKGIHAADGVKYADTLVFVGENGIVNASNGAAMACRVMSADFKRAAEFCEKGTADDSYINRMTLVEGRFPQKRNECVVDYEAAQNYPELAVGGVIMLSGDGTNLSDELKVFTYKIVGTVSSPMYVSFERGTTDIAAGTLGMYIYIDENCFAGETYNAAYAVIDNKADYDVYSEEYQNTVREAGERIEKISQPSITARLADVKADYQKRIKDGKAAYEELEKSTTKQLRTSLDKINDIQNYIDNGGNDIAAEKKSLKQRISAAEDRLAASKENYDENLAANEKDKSSARDKGNELSGSTANAKQIYNNFLSQQKADRNEIDGLYTTLNSLGNERSSAKNSWDSAERDYQSAVNAVSSKEAELKETQANIDKYQKQKDEWTEESLTSIDYINSKIREYNQKYNRQSNELESLKTKRSQADSARSDAKRKYEEAVNKYNNLEITIGEREATYKKNQKVLAGYEEDIRRLQAGQDALTIFKNQISQSERNLLASKIAITESQLRLYYEESTGRQKITAAEADLKAAKTRLETAEKNYSVIEHDTKIQLANAQGDIDKAQLFLDELNKSVWLVSYQNELPGHESYGQSLENINAIANVFPVFFYVIAAFMCLMTMTRMVQEERMQLGTLKALGYSGTKMVLKYYYYAALACAAGSVIGTVAGTLIFPKAVDSAYGMMYNLPSVRISFNWFYIAIGTLCSFAVTLIATRFACRSELKVQAAHLMRPKAPPAGKRIFIERFSTIWSTVSFGAIVTMRNMFRSKRRMIITIIGVASCTTLILSAFGLSNSVDKIISAQYGEGGIAGYDLMVTLDEAQIANESETLDSMKKDIRVKNGMLLDNKTMTAQSDNGTGTSLTAHVIIPQDDESVSKFFSLRTRSRNRKITLEPDGAVISEKLSKDTGVGKGDTLILKSISGDEYAVTVSEITENYLDHYVYISPECYKASFGEAPEYKNIVLKLENFTAEGDEQNLADDLLAYNNVTGVASTDTMIRSFNAVIDRLDVVIIIFIVAAGLLALIILYNLTNISIQERLREIATIKVLGFTDAEVTSYVYRENIFLTAAGILLGLIGGSVLHKVIINIAEVNIAMFGREIYWWSFALAIFMTAVFAAAVCVLVHRRLQTLDTVAALKSVE